MTASKNIVPFGKHKGQPVEVLLADRSYSEWLAAQAWFRERFVDLFRLIDAGSGRREETPEHNAMQVKFLDRAHFETWVVRKRGPEHLARCLKEIASREATLNQEALVKVQRNWERRFQRGENGQYDLSAGFAISVSAKADPAVIARYAEAMPRNAADLLPEDTVSLPRPSSISDFRLGYHKSFEDKGADVRVDLQFSWDSDATQHSGPPSYLGSETFRIELKPTIGDDFPAVLRQAQASRCDLVIAGEYSGSGATWEQVQEVFKTSQIILILESDLSGS